MSFFSIGKKKIGPKNKTFVIAEVGQAHDGSIGIAHSYIDAAHKAGVDAVKFQTHIAEEESTYDEKFRIKFSYQDKNRFDYWKRMEFSPEQWFSLYEHAKKLGLIFLSSAFSNSAFELLNKMNLSIPKAVESASKRIRPFIRKTYFTYSHNFSELLSLHLFQ